MLGCRDIRTLLWKNAQSSYTQLLFEHLPEKGETALDISLMNKYRKKTKIFVLSENYFIYMKITIISPLGFAFSKLNIPRSFNCLAYMQQIYYYSAYFLTMHFKLSTSHFTCGVSMELNSVL